MSSSRGSRSSRRSQSPSLQVTGVIELFGPGFENHDCGLPGSKRRIAIQLLIDFPPAGP